jgi:hypothetical protein
MTTSSPYSSTMVAHLLGVELGVEVEVEWIERLVCRRREHLISRRMQWLQLDCPLAIVQRLFVDRHWRHAEASLIVVQIMTLCTCFESWHKWVSKARSKL